MWTAIAVLSFLGIFVFIVLALISVFRKTKKGKKMMLFATGCFALVIISAFMQDEKTATTAAITENKEAESKKSVDTVEEDQKKAENDAKEKAEDEAAAKKKAEEEAKKKAEQETPEYKLKKAITKALGKESNRDGEKLSELTLDQASGNIVVKFKGDDNLTSNLIVTGIKMDIKDSLEAVKKSGVTFNNINVITSFSMVDQYGNAKESDVIDLTYSKATVDKINFDNFLTENVYSVADVVGLVHPEFTGKKD